MGWLCLVYENISLHQHEKADLCCMRLCFLCMMPLKYKILSHLIIGLSLKVKFKKLFKKCIVVLNNARSTVCPAHWAAVVLVLVESSMRFSRLKDRLSWFTPSNYIVSVLYAVYNAYNVLHVIKQPSACWTSLIMFSGRVFPPKIAQCLRLLVGFKPCKCFIIYKWSVK